MENPGQKRVKVKIPQDVHVAWERDFSFLGTYLMACQHMKELKMDLGVTYSMCAFFHRKNQIKFFRSQQEEEAEGKSIALKYLKSGNFRKNILDNIWRYSDLIIEFIKKEKTLSKDNIKPFFKLLNDHFVFHHAVYWAADYLGKNNLKNKYSYHLKKLYDARKYNENVLPKVESWLFKNNSDCLLLTPQECVDYKTKNIKISQKIQKERNIASFSYFNSKDSAIFTGEKALYWDKKFNKVILKKYWPESVIKGKTVFAGIYKGKIRVVLKFADFKKIKKGEILVAPMTLPKYNQYIKKAGAIITDEGAVLSHAAILARENRIPCIIGTKIATKVLKDDDRVEVDAEKGIIKII